jgi:hypothetical protein
MQPPILTVVRDLAAFGLAEQNTVMLHRQMLLCPSAYEESLPPCLRGQRPITCADRLACACLCGFVFFERAMLALCCCEREG